MNIENLKRAIRHLKTINPELFDIGFYRNDINDEPECGSTGCIIGHCTILDSDNVIKKYTKVNSYNRKIIDFYRWSFDFFGSLNQREWDYMFSSKWHFGNNTNTIEHAIYRIQRIIDGYQPECIDDEIEVGSWKECENL